MVARLVRGTDEASGDGRPQLKDVDIGEHKTGWGARMYACVRRQDQDFWICTVGVRSETRRLVSDGRGLIKLQLGSEERQDERITIWP